MRRPAVLLVVLLLSFSLAHAQASQPKPDQALAGFDQFVEQVLKDWKVPGAAVAVVHGDKVVLAKGYGLRDTEKKLPATPRTLFAIGSITKSFTVAGLATMVDQGKVAWDTPVREYLPEFRLYDEMASERITPRDLVTHRSGLPRHDLMWYNSPLPRKELVRRIRYLEPNKDFRANWQYQNLMFLTAGYLAGEVAGSTWEEATRKNLFEPLGMKRSNFAVAESEKSDDFSFPYERGKVEGKEIVKQIPFRSIDEVGPAGSINSSVEEMAHYVLIQLNGGKLGERQVVSAANIREMHTPQMVMPAPVLFPELGHTAYGMGWAVTTYRGRKFVHHGGGIDGFTALVAMLPAEKIGVVVLTNLSGNPAPTIVSYNVFDRLLGMEQVGWNQRFLERRAQGEQSEEEAKKKGFSVRKPNTRPAHAIEEYLGSFEHAAYGPVRIERGPGDDLKVTYNRFTSPLKHFHYEVFEVPEDPFDRLAQTKVRFHTDVDGEVSGLFIALEPNVKAIFFARVADPIMREKSFLQPLTGDYQLGPNVVSVSLRGDDTLVLSLPGQPVYTLEPVKGTTFRVQGLTGFSLEFKKDAAGTVTEAVFYQPGATLVAKRK